MLKSKETDRMRKERISETENSRKLHTRIVPNKKHEQKKEN